jgi:hypothetical protein
MKVLCILKFHGEGENERTRRQRCTGPRVGDDGGVISSSFLGGGAIHRGVFLL